MRADTLKKWLEEQGCRFDEKAHGHGEGHGSLVVKLEGKESLLPLIGTHQDLSHEDVERIVRELDLDSSKLPASQDTETEKYRHGSTSRG